MYRDPAISRACAACPEVAAAQRHLRAIFERLEVLAIEQASKRRLEAMIRAYQAALLHRNRLIQEWQAGGGGPGNPSETGATTQP